MDSWMQEVTVLRVAQHASQVAPGGVFCAMQGARYTGVDFIPEAISRGVKRVIVQQDVHIPEATLAMALHHEVQIQYVADIRKALAHESAMAYGYPAHRLCIIGVTGTVGKTTTASLIYHGLRSAGISAALLSSAGNYIHSEKSKSDLTTKQADYVHAFFAAAVARGVTHVVMEVAAQAVTLHRVDGILFHTVVWTNFSSLHSEFYATEEEYFQAKATLLTRLIPGGTAIVPASQDRIGALPVSEGAQRILFEAPVLLEEAQSCKSPSVAIVCEGKVIRCAQAIGAYHAENMIAGIYALQSVGLSLESIRSAYGTFPGVAGRAECISLSNGALAIIDMAHTPQSVKSVLSAVRPYTSHLIVLMGAGGDRDRSNRPLNAKEAAMLADVLILTSDNPRSEDPRSICAEMEAGVKDISGVHVCTIIDRAEAISYAYSLTQAGSLLMLLGKGDDEWQIIGDVKIPFSERAIISCIGLKR